METYPNHMEPSNAHYFSFVLRCWSGEDFTLKARLIEVPSGISHPLADLSDLAGLLQSLLERRCEAHPVTQNDEGSPALAPGESPANGDGVSP